MRIIWCSVLCVAVACGGKAKKTLPDPVRSGGAADVGASRGGADENHGDMSVTTSTGDDLSWLGPVYFAFDSSDLSAEARGTLAKLGDWLAAHPKATLTIEGHCDEQGTTEYNIGLGQRRAQAITDYLARLGVASSRLRPVSYGSERPAADGHDEVAWSKNRRGELRPSR